MTIKHTQRKGLYKLYSWLALHMMSQDYELFIDQKGMRIKLEKVEKTSYRNEFPIFPNILIYWRFYIYFWIWSLKTRKTHQWSRKKILKMSLNKMFQDKATILYHKSTAKKSLLNIFYLMLDSNWQVKYLERQWESSTTVIATLSPENLNESQFYKTAVYIGELRNCTNIYFFYVRLKTFIMVQVKCPENNI